MLADIVWTLLCGESTNCNCLGLVSLVFELSEWENIHEPLNETTL